MKKYTLYYIALSALAMLTGCSNEENFGLKPTDGNRSLTATIEQNDLSRTAVSEEGQVTWTETDAIGVFGTASQNIRFTYQSSTDNGNSATFRGDFPEEETMEQAYYPYQENATLSGNALTLHLPSEYTYTGNSNAPMLGVKNNDGTFTFKHLTGLLRITINNVPEEADRFVITSSGETNAPDIAGQATITDINAEDATLSITANGSKSITYNLGTLTEETGFRTFFVPLPVGEYPQLSVALYAKDSTDPYFTKTISDITVRRAVMIDMPILDAQTGAQYVLSENTIQLSKEDESYIESVEQTGNETSDENIITYQSDTPSDKLPKVGDILLYNEITEKFPSGFLGKVTKVEETNGGYVIHTKPAALDEAFNQLYIDEVYDLIPEDSEITQSRVAISTDEDGFFCFTTPLTLEKEPISVNGSATTGFKLHVHFELNIESGLPPYAFVTLQSKVNSSFGFGIHAENEFLNPKIPLIRIPLNKTPGTIILTPSIDLSIVGELTGDIGFDANVEFSKKTVGAILCNQGIWEAGANDVDSEGFLKMDMDSNTSITVKGSVFMGLGMGLELKLFNNDNVKIGIEPKVGLTESAALTFDLPSLSENSYEVLKDSKIDLSLGVHIDAEASANILKDSKALLKTSIFNDNFFEKSYYLFPDFEEPIINVDKESKTAQVNYNVTRDLIFKSGIGVKLYEGDVLTATSPIENYELEEGYKNPLQVTFNNLKPEQNYKVCPYVSFFNLPFEATPAKTFTLEDAPEPEGPLSVTTGFVSNITKTGATLTGLLSNMQQGETYKYGISYSTDRDPTGIHKNFVEATNNQDGTFSVTLSSLTTGTTYYWCAYAYYNDTYIWGEVKSFTPVGSDRDILVALYEATGGENWVNNTNWCTEAPLNEWYGIEATADGKVTDIDLRNNGLIGTMDLKGLLSLTGFVCDENQITSINLSGCYNLRHVSCYENPDLTSVDVSDCYALTQVWCIDNEQLTKLNVSRGISIEYINCYNNQITKLDVSNLKNLKTLICAENQISLLNVSQASELLSINCQQNKLTSLDVSDLKNLTDIWCDNNEISSLNVSGCANLSRILCENNQLTELETKGLTSLKELNCTNNRISTLDVFDSLLLNELYCKENPITKIRLSKEPSIFFEIDYWGERNNQKYSEPNHKNGYQYPEFIYQ